MAAVIEKRMGIKADLIEGSGGILEVWADGVLFYTNKEEAALPYPGDDEMVRGLQSLKPAEAEKVSAVTSETIDDGNAPSRSIEPPPVVPSPPPEKWTDIDRMTFACSCAPAPGPEGCACRN